MGTSLSLSVLSPVAHQGCANILDIFCQATVKERVDGRDWYFRAWEEAFNISRHYDVPIETVVKVACALSPRLKWENNMPAAEAVVRWFKAGGYVPEISRYVSGGEKLQRTKGMDASVPVISDDPGLPAIPGPTRTNIVKALWVCQGHEWVLRGKKVNSFLDNILNWATSDAVTVDSHAIQVWRGVMEEGTYAVPDSWYEVIAADYRKVAQAVGMTPAALQAVTWLVKKRVTAEQSKARSAAKKVKSRDHVVWTVAELPQEEQDKIARGETTFEHAQRREMLKGYN